MNGLNEIPGDQRMMNGLNAPHLSKVSGLWMGPPFGAGIFTLHMPTLSDGPSHAATGDSAAHTQEAVAHKVAWGILPLLAAVGVLGYVAVRVAK